MQVKFHNTEYPEGLEFDVGGLLLPNGQAVELDEDAVALFMARNGKEIKEALGTNPQIEIDGQKGEYVYLNPPEEEAQEETVTYHEVTPISPVESAPVGEPQEAGDS